MLGADASPTDLRAWCFELHLRPGTPMANAGPIVAGLGFAPLIRGPIGPGQVRASVIPGDEASRMILAHDWGLDAEYSVYVQTYPNEFDAMVDTSRKLLEHLEGDAILMVTEMAYFNGPLLRRTDGRVCADQGDWRWPPQLLERLGDLLGS